MSQERPTHIDRNFVQELDVFDSYDRLDEDLNLPIRKTSTLIKHLIFYAAYKYQTEVLTLDKSFVLDLDEFAKFSGYNKKHLQFSHPTPKQRQDIFDRKNRKEQEKFLSEHSMEDITIEYGSIIENTLYRVVTTPPILQNKYTYVEQDGSIVSNSFIEGVPIFHQLNIRTIKSKNGKLKKYYVFQLSDMMCRNFSRIFTRIDYKKIVEFRKKQLDDLYIRLADIKYTLQSKGITETKAYNFDALADICGISNSNHKNQKATITKKIDQINELSDLKVTLRWEANPHTQNQRAKYTPVLIFEPDVKLMTSKIDELFGVFVKALFSKLPPIEELKNKKGEAPFTDKDRFEHSLISLIKTYQPDRIVNAKLNMTFYGAVCEAYAYSQAVVFGNNDCLKATQLIYEHLKNCNNIEDIKTALSKRY